VIGSQHILLAPTIDRSAHTTSVGNSNLLTPPPMQPEQQLKISQVAANASRNSFMGQPHTPVDMSDASMAKQSTLAGAGSVPNKFTPGVAGGFGLNKFAPGAAGFGTAVGGGDPTMPDSYGQPDTYDCAICQGGGDSFDLSDLGGFDSTDDSGDVQVKKGWGDLGAITAIVDMIDAMWRFMSGEKESSSCSDCDFCDEVKKCIKEDKKTPVSGGGGAITVACDSGSTSYSGIQTIKLDCTELQLSSLTPSSVDISLKPGFWGGVTDNVSIVYVSGVSFNSTSCTFTTTMSTLTFSFNNGIFTGVS